MITPNQGRFEHSRCQREGQDTAVLQDISPFRKWRFGARKTLSAWYRSLAALLQVFGLELRSFVQRIRLRGEKRYRHGLLVLDPVFHREPDARLEECTRTHDCMTDIESFWAAHPWATVLDAETYLDGWRAGAQWAARNPCSCRSGHADV